MSKLLLSLLLTCSIIGGVHGKEVQAESITKLASPSWVEANGVSLRYELTGAGSDTLVLLHEFCMSLETWDLIMPELVKNHRVLRYDLRGFGLSEKIYGSVTFDDYIQDLHGLLDVLGINTKVTLIGGAFGGAISLAFAATYPERVKGVIAMSPAVNVKSQKSIGYSDIDKNAKRSSSPAAVVTLQKSAGSSDVAESTERSAMKTILEEQMDKIYPMSIRADEKRTAWFRGMQLATDPHNLAACMRMMADTEFSGYFKKITAPTLIIAAGLYPARSVESMQQIANSIKEGQLEVLQTGHFIEAQSPEMLIPVLQSFLPQLSR
jgi:3-oxoadipate enol-lactonase